MTELMKYKIQKFWLCNEENKGFYFSPLSLKLHMSVCVYSRRKKEENFTVWGTNMSEK